MNKSLKTKKASAPTKPEVKSRKNSRGRKKIKLVEKAEEEVKDESEDDAERIVSYSQIAGLEGESLSENESAGIESESDDEEEIKSESDDEKEIKTESDDEEEIKSESDSEDEQEKVATRKRKKSKYNAEEEARLERLVFGDTTDVINNLLERKVVKIEAELDRTKNLPESLEEFNDNRDADSDDEMQSDEESLDFPKIEENKNGAAWIDEDDLQYSIEDALKQQNRKLPNGRKEEVYTELLESKFTEIVGTPKWASLETQVQDEDEDSDREILKHSSHLTASKSKKLRKGVIDIKVLTEINKSTHNEGPFVSSLQFHPTSTVALVAGQSGILSLFQIDGRENAKLHSIRFDNFSISCSKFLKEGNEIIMGSRWKPFSQNYDLMSGKTYKIPLPHGITNMQKFEVSPDGKWIAIVGRMGQIHLLSAATKERVADFKMNKRCLALTFSPDSQTLITHGDTEEMYIWDLKSRSCLHRAIDDGCIANSAVAFSPSGQFVATGSKQGVVNIYDAESVLKNRNPAPLKIILNLVTPITALKFNPTSEILAMSSHLKENAFKMVHIPSFSVFSNFPTFQTKMHNPLEIDFSPGSGYIGISNKSGHAYLYRLKHYGNY